MANIPVLDPFGVAGDGEMPTLALAINPVEVERQLRDHLLRLAGENGYIHLIDIRVRRYKPGRRCVIEYKVRVERSGFSPEVVVLIGKVRRRRTGKRSYQLLELLWNAGFRSNSQDGISVPEPIGTVPEFQMWLQRKVSGKPATDLLVLPDGVLLARRIAQAAHKLHMAGVPAPRRHSIVDELKILHEHLPAVAQWQPCWSTRIRRLLEACDCLGATLPNPIPQGIHRDFYSDQVIVDEERLYLIDFDLYCEGDPGLDIGNFLGHITEQSLRIYGDINVLSDRERAMQERFVELSGGSTRAAVEAYQTLTLVRHIYLSMLFPQRRPFITKLLEICEERLGIR